MVLIVNGQQVAQLTSTMDGLYIISHQLTRVHLGEQGRTSKADYMKENEIRKE